jgi:hypothetical protein
MRMKRGITGEERDERGEKKEEERGGGSDGREEEEGHRHLFSPPKNEKFRPCPAYRLIKER